MISIQELEPARNVPFFYIWALDAGAGEKYLGILPGNRVETFGCQYTDSLSTKKSPAWGEELNFLAFRKVHFAKLAGFELPFGVVAQLNVSIDH